MCRLYGTVCVIFRARLVFPRINGLTVYPIFSCLSSLNFVCCFYAVYFAWKLIFLFLPYLWQLEKEEGRRREDELQKERERVLLERRQKEEENQFVKQVRGKWMFRCCCCCCFFIYCGFNQVNLLKRVVNVFRYPFVFRRRRNKKWKGRGKKKKRRLVSVTRLNLNPPYWTKTDWWRSCYWIIFTCEIENENTISSLDNR